MTSKFESMKKDVELVDRCVRVCVRVRGVVCVNDLVCVCE